MKKVYLLSAVIFLVLLFLLFWGIKKYGADTIYRGELLSTKKITVNGQNYSVNKYSDNKQSVFILSLRRFLVKKEIILSGFENEVETCGTPVIKDKRLNVLCLKGNVGAHSQTVELVDLDSFTPVKVIDEDGVVTDFFVSDVPDFEYSDGIFYCHYRNYDKNPLTDAIRYSFVLKNGVFIFDKKANITYDGNSISTKGEI